MNRLKAENLRLKAELARVNGLLKTQSQSSKTAADDYPEINPAELAKKPRQQVYVRKDKLNALYYLYPQASVDAKGASVTWSNDYLKDTQSLAIQGFVSYVPSAPYSFHAEVNSDPSLSQVDVPLQLSRYAAGPYVYGSGTIGSPRKAGEKSALQVGLDNQFEIEGGGVFKLQTLGISPYYQTDFRGEAQIYGVTALWEPYRPGWSLGGTRNNGQSLVSMYWRAIAEADVFRVAKAGETSYKDDTNTALLGGTISLNGVLFQNMPEVGAALCGRIGFNAQYQYFWDAVSGNDLHNLHGEVDYNISGKKNYATRLCPDSPASASGAVGTTAVALTYDDGTDKDTREKRKKLQLQLTYQY
ncbi:hypothetical protein FJ420_30625 [Mesorhizobium sp. B3-1-3]|uniref:hypothetical protein n=1 Tax=unclassified Mesorhizobium TaxID=325217 RepID=UPI00112CB49D|nr:MULTISPECIES: hypothetical protein [unclassified Mesorhizobium]TPI54205.1 hypothetical protein FJ424_31425 [Mesorhizobium sp. B3-1-8]TPI61433.1 hypothetical protein FJ420_30625 [Mesorhizobium sp. B3-1-3]